MAECSQGRWLLLIYQIPPKPAYLRVKVWRRLQSLGAVAIKNTVYVIPKSDDTIEDFQWVAREIVEEGGEATICAAGFIEGLSDEQVEAFFHAARDADYGQFADDARELLHSVPKRTQKAKGEYHSAFEADLNRLRKRLTIITAMDFFGAPGRSVADAVMLQLESRLGQTRSDRSRASKDERLAVADFAGRAWITRKGIYVDRIACAWLIQRFIDPNAQVCFVSDKNYRHRPPDVRFDMFGGEFTHQGDLCSFEVLVKRFFPEDRALGRIGRIVHDLDLKDGKFRKPETAGVGSLIEGIGLVHKTDEDRLEAGRVVFDHLYASFNHD
ncbi:MAG: chromate resistance protein ChrB domain-containing protein [Hyphomicrobiales bacterium]